MSEFDWLTKGFESLQKNTNETVDNLYKCVYENLVPGMLGSIAVKEGAKLGEAIRELGTGAVKEGAKLADSMQGIEQQKKFSSNNELTEEQKALTKCMSKAINTGNLEYLEALVHSRKGQPETLRRVIKELNTQLKSKGIHISYGVGNVMYPESGDQDFHKEGSLTIYKEGCNRAIDLNTDARSSTGVGGPVEWSKDGQATNFLVAYPNEDPAKLLKRMMQ